MFPTGIFVRNQVVVNHQVVKSVARPMLVARVTQIQFNSTVGMTPTGRVMPIAITLDARVMSHIPDILRLIVRAIFLHVAQILTLTAMTTVTALLCSCSPAL